MLKLVSARVFSLVIAGMVLVGLTAGAAISTHASANTTARTATTATTANSWNSCEQFLASALAQSKLTNAQIKAQLLKAPNGASLATRVVGHPGQLMSVTCATSGAGNICGHPEIHDVVVWMNGQRVKPGQCVSALSVPIAPPGWGVYHSSTK